MRPAYLAATLLASSLVFGASSARAGDTWSDPFPGVKHLHRVTTGPNQNINVLKVDLCSAGLSVRATRPEEKGKKTSAFGALVGADFAINGDFYKSGFGLERGIGVGDGAVWSVATPEDNSVGQLAFGDRHVEIIRDAVIQGVEPWMKNVVGGRPSLLENGAVTDSSIAMHPGLCARNPRTAVGLSADHRTLYLAVVDGRHSTRVGMTCNELAGFMKEMGAHDALNFDGGGSSTMWFKDRGVLNFPTDGTERTVGNHLAFHARGAGESPVCPATGAKPPPSKTETDGTDSTSSELTNGTGGSGPSGSAAAEEASAEAGSEGCNTSARTRPGVALAGLAALALAVVRVVRRRRDH